MNTALDTYLREVRRYADVPPERREELFRLARSGDGRAKVDLVRACLLETAQVVLDARRPDWMLALDAVQDANLVLMRLVDDPAITHAGELPAALEARIRQHLTDLADRWPDGSPRS